MKASNIHVYNEPIHFVYNQGLGYPNFQTIHFSILAINSSNLSLFDIIFSHFTQIILEIETTFDFIRSP